MDWGKFGLGKRNVSWTSTHATSDGHVYYPIPVAYLKYVCILMQLIIGCKNESVIVFLLFF